MGSALGLLAGMIIMLFMCRNYHYMMCKYPDAGGIYSYTKNIFGYDIGFVNAWFLMLTYLAMFWANATSLPLFIRLFWGDILEAGYLYSIFGYDVYLGEAVLSIVAMAVACFVCINWKKFAARSAVFLCVLFTVGISVCFAAAMLRRDAGAYPIEPLFVSGSSAASQILRIACITPWAFIGFENISHSVGEFSFSPKKSLRILVTSVIVTTLLYIFIMILSVSVFPEGYVNWFDYLRDLRNLEGLEAVPGFFAAGYFLGDFGSLLLRASLLALILTSLIGNAVAVSRLFLAMANDHVLPEKYASVNAKGSPDKAILLIMAVSLLIPLMGRNAIGWIVDVTTIGATIVYGFISAAAYTTAKKNNDTAERFAGLVGIVTMLAFALLQMFPIFSVVTMEVESYFLFTVWSILGFFYFRSVLLRDTAKRFGKSIIVWITLLSFIIIMSMGWMERAGELEEREMANNIRDYYNSPLEYRVLDGNTVITQELEKVHAFRQQHTSVIIALFMFALAMMLYNHSVVRRRTIQTELELDKTKALALKDAMTGVNNKYGYAKKEKILDRMIDDDMIEQLALVVFDVNGLKFINDTQGHKAGDEYIKSACRMICTYFKHSPVYRIGGDEFVVVMDGDDFPRRADILAALNREVEDNVGTGRVVVSAGMADYNRGDDVSLHEIFQRADKLMYKRKKQLKGMGAVTRD